MYKSKVMKICWNNQFRKDNSGIIGFYSPKLLTFTLFSVFISVLYAMSSTWHLRTGNLIFNISNLLTFNLKKKCRLTFTITHPQHTHFTTYITPTSFFATNLDRFISFNRNKSVSSSYGARRVKSIKRGGLKRRVRVFALSYWTSWPTFICVFRRWETSHFRSQDGLPIRKTAVFLRTRHWFRFCEHCSRAVPNQVTGFRSIPGQTR